MLLYQYIFYFILIGNIIIFVFFKFITKNDHKYILIEKDSTCDDIKECINHYRNKYESLTLEELLCRVKHRLNKRYDGYSDEYSNADIEDLILKQVNLLVETNKWRMTTIGDITIFHD